MPPSSSLPCFNRQIVLYLGIKAESVFVNLLCPNFFIGFHDFSSFSHKVSMKYTKIPPQRKIPSTSMRIRPTRNDCLKPQNIAPYETVNVPVVPDQVLVSIKIVKRSRSLQTTFGPDFQVHPVAASSNGLWP